jgi:hypothetical protein
LFSALASGGLRLELDTKVAAAEDIASQSSIGVT